MYSGNMSFDHRPKVGTKNVGFLFLTFLFRTVREMIDIKNNKNEC